MRLKYNVLLFCLVIVATSCVSKKKLVSLETQLETSEKELETANKDIVSNKA